MHLYIELWKTKPAWLALSRQERAEYYMTRIAPVLGGLQAEGMELVGLALNDGGMPGTRDYRYIAAWKAGEPHLIGRLQSELNAIGWSRYFERIETRGEILGTEQAMTDLINANGMARGIPEPTVPPTSETAPPTETTMLGNGSSNGGSWLSGIPLAGAWLEKVARSVRPATGREPATVAAPVVSRVPEAAPSPPLDIDEPVRPSSPAIDPTPPAPEPRREPEPTEPIREPEPAVPIREPEIPEPIEAPDPKPSVPVNDPEPEPPIPESSLLYYDERAIGAVSAGTTEFDIEAYLRRINYRGSTEPTLGTLRALHRAHLLAVPFENLDIHCGRPIVLDEARLFDKVVRQRRGGFCYELNGLFARLLRELGYNVTMVSAGVVRAEGGFGPEFDHLALMVKLDERWLADVGFGDSFIEPLRLDDPGVQAQDDRAYRIDNDGGRRTLLSREEEGGAWRGEYVFTLLPRRLEEFAAMCDYHQTSPDSVFTHGRVCSRLTQDGRISLSDNRFITTVRGRRREQELARREEFDVMLRQYFGIDMTRE